MGDKSNHLFAATPIHKGFGMLLAFENAMDEKHFKKHLSDLVHGHHHPEEHDWASAAKAAPAAKKTKSSSRSTVKKKAATTPRKAKRKSK